MKDLIEKIEKLSREEALEASGFVSKMLTANENVGKVEKNFLKPLIEQPYQNLPEIEQLARLMLMAAAVIPEYEDTVRKAIEGAGKKQFILGGTEIVALAVVALAALQIVISKGRTSNSEMIVIEEKDGKTTTTIKNETTYGISLKLGSVLKSYFQRD